MQMVKKSANGWAKTVAHSLRTLGMIPLGPCDLVTLSAASELYTSSGPISVITGESSGRVRLVNEGASKELVENVILKNESMRLALFAGSDACRSLQWTVCGMD